MLTVKKKIIWKRALLESGLIEKYKYTRGGSSWVRGGQLTESRTIRNISKNGNPR